MWGEGNWERTAGERKRREKSVWLRDRAVGDKVKERPAEFLECTGGLVGGGGVCKGQFVGYESMRACICVCMCESSV